MHLSPQERDKLLVHLAADVARSRRARGLRMNHPEAVEVEATFPDGTKLVTVHGPIA